VPEKLHRKLKKEAEQKGLTGERKDAYIFGTLDKVEKFKKLKRNKK